MDQAVVIEQARARWPAQVSSSAPTPQSGGGGCSAARRRNTTPNRRRLCWSTPRAADRSSAPPSSPSARVGLYERQKDVAIIVERRGATWRGIGRATRRLPARVGRLSVSANARPGRFRPRRRRRRRRRPPRGSFPAFRLPSPSTPRTAWMMAATSRNGEYPRQPGPVGGQRRHQLGEVFLAHARMAASAARKDPPMLVA